MYVVVVCTSCGGYILAKSVHKSRSCPHCGYRTILRGLKVLAQTESPREAVAMIQALKRSKKK